MTHPRLSWRDFLKPARATLLLTIGLLGLVGLARLLSYSSQPPVSSDIDLGPALSYSPGSRMLLPEVQALLVNGKTGFTALSLVCTHLGCSVESRPDGFTCPCHGS